MTQKPRAVIDTSTLIGAVLRPQSVPQQAVLSAVKTHELCVSNATLDELRTVFQRAKFDRYVSLPDRLLFLDLVVSKATRFEVDHSYDAAAADACRDPKDAKFLALALASGANTIISSDLDLLVLHPWKDISILTPAGFLQMTVSP